MTTPAAAKLSVFERYLSIWVGFCIALGVLVGKLVPSLVHAVRGLEFGHGSQINAPIAVLIWLMIYPMMLRIDFVESLGVGRRPGGILVTLFVNWLVKPFSMALLGWLFFKHLFLPLIGAELARPVRRRARSFSPPRRAPRWCSCGRTSPTAIRHTRSSRCRSTISIMLVAVRADRGLAGRGRERARRAVSGAALQRGRVHRDSARARGSLTRAALVRAGRRVVREHVRAVLPAGHDDRAARHARADLRVSGRQHHGALVPRAADRGADPASRSISTPGSPTG